MSDLRHCFVRVYYIEENTVSFCMFYGAKMILFSCVTQGIVVWLKTYIMYMYMYVYFDRCILLGYCIGFILRLFFMLSLLYQ